MAASDDSPDAELKFDGAPIRQLGGAPAELVAESLRSLQRMAHLIGMKKEGQRFGQKARPNAKVRRLYAVVCRPSEAGSYRQPWSLTPLVGKDGAASNVARGELLRALRAFDSGDDAKVAEALPDARQRWFFADAAAGLLPSAESGIDVTVRVGSGRFAFSAARARAAIERTRAGDPPVPEQEEIVGKLKAIDYSYAIMTIKPLDGRQIKLNYPLQLEAFIQRNVRRRLRIIGAPIINSSGEVSGFRKLSELSEVEPSSAKLDAFVAGSVQIIPTRPYGYLVGFDATSSIFFVRDPEISLDVFASNLEDLEAEVRSDLDILWRTYALASDRDLTPEAQLLKKALRAKFKGVS